MLWKYQHHTRLNVTVEGRSHNIILRTSRGEKHIGIILCISSHIHPQNVIRCCEREEGICSRHQSVRSNADVRGCSCRVKLHFALRCNIDAVLRLFPTRKQILPFAWPFLLLGQTGRAGFQPLRPSANTLTFAKLLKRLLALTSLGLLLLRCMAKPLPHGKTTLLQRWKLREVTRINKRCLLAFWISPDQSEDLTRSSHGTYCLYTFLSQRKSWLTCTCM